MLKTILGFDNSSSNYEQNQNQLKDKPKAPNTNQFKPDDTFTRKRADYESRSQASQLTNDQGPPLASQESQQVNTNVQHVPGSFRLESQSSTCHHHAPPAVNRLVSKQTYNPREDPPQKIARKFDRYFPDSQVYPNTENQRLSLYHREYPELLNGQNISARMKNKGDPQLVPNQQLPQYRLPILPSRKTIALRKNNA